ncbi:hypothetical protein Taro_018353 [Colocasia esculenta]|uniref:Tubulin-specific chaperone A n=1 Tax=Colocasia esculenta TaxID=4460 RepID=A0A843UYU8_COLES|nr:hypothetical protein [Colocasia esculenta]
MASCAWGTAAASTSGESSADLPDRGRGGAEHGSRREITVAITGERSLAVPRPDHPLVPHPLAQAQELANCHPLVRLCNSWLLSFAVAQAAAECGEIYMATLRNLKIKTSTCKRILKELHSYENEVEREAAKTADMKDKGADPYDLKQQENVLSESRMMIPDCRKRLEASLADLKGTLAEFKNTNQQGADIDEAESMVAEVEAFFQNAED